MAGDLGVAVDGAVPDGVGHGHVAGQEAVKGVGGHGDHRVAVRRRPAADGERAGVGAEVEELRSYPQLARLPGGQRGRPARGAQPGWGLLGAAGRPTALPAGQTCELRVGPEVFYLSSDAGTLTVRRGPAPDGDAVITMPADTLYSLLTGQVTVTDAVRRSTVDGDTTIARRALEPLAAALTKPAPAM